MSPETIAAELTKEGAEYEVTVEAVGEYTYPVFKKRLKNLVQLLYAGQGFSEREALVDGNHRFTFAELITRVELGSRWLSDTCGVGKGDRVAIYAENSVQWVIAFWSITSLGGVAVAMNGWWTESEFADAWQLTSPKLLLADDKRLLRLSNSSTKGRPPSSAGEAAAV